MIRKLFLDEILHERPLGTWRRGLQRFSTGPFTTTNRLDAFSTASVQRPGEDQLSCGARKRAT